MSDLGAPKSSRRELGTRKQTKSITWRGAVIILILALLLIFMLSNLNVVPIHILFWQLDVWIWALVLIPFILGILTGGHVRRGLRGLRKPKPVEPGK